MHETRRNMARERTCICVLSLTSQESAQFSIREPTLFAALTFCSSTARSRATKT